MFPIEEDAPKEPTIFCCCSMYFYTVFTVVIAVISSLGMLKEIWMTYAAASFEPELTKYASFEPELTKYALISCVKFILLVTLLVFFIRMAMNTTDAMRAWACSIVCMVIPLNTMLDVISYYLGWSIKFIVIQLRVSALANFIATCGNNIPYDDVLKEWNPKNERITNDKPNIDSFNAFLLDIIFPKAISPDKCLNDFHSRAFLNQDYQVVEEISFWYLKYAFNSSIIISCALSLYIAYRYYQLSNYLYATQENKQESKQQSLF